MKKMILAFLILLGSGAQAAELHQSYRPIRGLGMGGVNLATVRGAEVVFQNPAALLTIDTLDIHAVGINVGARVPSKEDLDAISGIDASDPNSYNDLFGRKIHLNVNARTAFATPYFGFGYYREVMANLELHNPTLPAFSTYLRNDEGYVLAAAMPILNRMAVGMSVKRLNRQGGDTKEVGITEVTDGIESVMDTFENRGQAHGIDISFLARGASIFNPTFSAALRDVGVTKFRKTGGSHAPASIDQNLVAGGSILVTNKMVDWTLGFEADHLLDPDIEIGKKLHLGTELSIPGLDIRAGFNQGYFTYGVGVDLFFMRLDAASYYEEMGVFPGQRAELRYAISLSVDLSFDGAFNILDKNGKRLKLKQRR